MKYKFLDKVRIVGDDFYPQKPEGYVRHFRDKSGEYLVRFYVGEHSTIDWFYEHQLELIESAVE